MPFADDLRAALDLEIVVPVLNEGSVKNKLSELRTKKLAHGDNKNGYHLMQAGSLIGGSRASSASKSKKPCDL